MQHVSKPLFITALILIALNLRAPFTSVFPLLDELRQQLNMSPQQAGLLSTIPLMAFAIFSPIAARIARVINIEATITLGLITVISGLIIRVISGSTWLFLGTLLIGIGIAIINVILPSLIKKYFPNSSSSLTAMYILMMGLGAAASSSAVVPISQLTINGFLLSSTQLALIVTLPLTILALMFWLPLQVKHRNQATNTQTKMTFNIWKSPLAWKITLFFGLNSVFNYVFISWYPAMLTSLGYSVETAGFYHGVFQFSSAVPALVMAPLMMRYRNLSSYCLFAFVTVISGILGLLFIPQYALISGVLFGMGAGCGFTLGLSFITLKTSSPIQAAALSGMAQSLGYFLAAFSPVLVGYMHDKSNHWDSTFILLLMLVPIWILSGWSASRSQRIQ